MSTSSPNLDILDDRCGRTFAVCDKLSANCMPCVLLVLNEPRILLFRYRFSRKRLSSQDANSDAKRPTKAPVHCPLVGVLCYATRAPFTASSECLSGLTSEHGLHGRSVSLRRMCVEGATRLLQDRYSIRDRETLKRPEKYTQMGLRDGHIQSLSLAALCQ